MKNNLTQTTQTYRTQKMKMLDGTTKTQYYINAAAVMAEFNLDEMELRSMTASNAPGSILSDCLPVEGNGNWEWFMGFQIADARSTFPDGRGVLSACILLLLGARDGDPVREAQYMDACGTVVEDADTLTGGR